MKNISKKEKIVLILLLLIVSFVFLVYGGFELFKIYNNPIAENKNIEVNYIKNYSKKDFIKFSLRDFEIYNKYKLRKYIDNNFNKFLYSRGDLSQAILDYANLYENSFEILMTLHNKNLITYSDYREIYKYLDKFDFNSIQKKLKTITLKSANNNLIAEKVFFEGIIAELNFSDILAIKSYTVAINLNRLNPRYYESLGNTYNKISGFSDAIIAFENGLNVCNYNAKKDRDIELRLILNLGKTNLAFNRINRGVAYLNNLSIISRNYDNLNYEWLAVYNLSTVEATLGHYKEAINYAKYSLKLANKNRNDNQVLNSINLLSKIDYNYGDYLNGVKNSLKAVKIAKKMNNLSVLSNASLSVCLNYEYLDKVNEAINYCKRAVEINDKLGLVIKRPEQYLQNGYIYSFVGSIRNYNIAIDNYNMAYSLAKEYKLDLLKARALSGISNCEIILDKKDKALADLQEAIKIKENFGIYNEPCDDCNLGFINWQKKEYSEALANYKNSIIFADEIANDSSIFTSASHISSIYLQIGDYKAGLQYSELALKIAKNIYRYDHHYIRYQQSIQNNIEKSLLDINNK